ncbi:serine protease [Earliella scabrosa]|nr:serine protease [Earliella scabrosa]
MHLLSVLATALSLLGTALAASDEQVKPLVSTRDSGATSRQKSYIVKLKADAPKDKHLDWLSSKYASSAHVTHGKWTSDLLHGYAGVLDDDALEAVRLREDVEYLEESGMVYPDRISVQTGSPWGLQRITGVDVYVIDSGILTDHVEFQGRASWGATFGPFALIRLSVSMSIVTTTLQNIDDDGHGTHCAGTIAGATFGVAKRAHVIAVKVFGAQGGFTADIISGVNFVAQSAARSGRPSVASMSLRSAPSRALDAAVRNAINQGVYVVVSAGNKNLDATSQSPARVAEAITVGATSIKDVRADFSNFGPLVDIFAPGVDVISAGIDGTTSNATLSGTSMACPDVSGLVATLASNRRGAALTQKEMSDLLKQHATKNAIRGLPVNTVNLLARNMA